MNVHSKLPSDIEGLAHQVDPLSRRGFFMTSSAALAAGYTLAAGPVRARSITTDTNGLRVGDAKVKVAGGEMPVYFARPANAQNPPVILVAMEIFGLHEYIKDVTRRLAKLGAFAIAPDYYFRAGKDLTKITDIAEAAADRQRQDRRRTVRRSRRHRRLGEVAGRRHQPARHHGLLPRRPHRVALFDPQPEGLKAGVAFYGSLADKSDAVPKNSIELAPDVKEPVLGLYGEADAGIPLEQVKQMEAALKAAGKTAEFKIYPGAPHGFHADYRPSYRKEAAEDAWNQMQAWFRKYGVLA